MSNATILWGYPKTIILFISLCSYSGIRAQIWGNWHDKLFEISQHSTSFDYLKNKIRKHHIETIQLYYVSLSIDSVSLGKRFYHPNELLAQENVYNPEGMLDEYSTYDSWPIIKRSETHITHPDKFTTAFTIIYFHGHGIVDTTKAVNTHDSKNENTYCAYEHDTLISKEITHENGDTSYRSFFDSRHGIPWINFACVNKTGKYYNLKQSIWDKGAYTIQTRKLKILHYRDEYPQIDKTTITETINKRHTRESEFDLDKTGNVAQNYTTDYYYFADGRTRCIMLGEGFKILFFYNKYKMLTAVNYDGPSGDLIEGNVYKYTYR